MALSPTVRGVLLFVVCFASTGTAPLPRNNNVNAYASVANDVRIKNLASPSPWSPTAGHRIPSKWTTTTTNRIHSGRIKYTSRSTEISYSSAPVERKMISHFKSGKRGDGNPSTEGLPRKVTQDDREFQKWNQLPRAVAFNPCAMSCVFQNVFQGRNRTSPDRGIDKASSAFAARHQRPIDVRSDRDLRRTTIAAYSWKRPTDHRITTSSDALLFIGTLAGVVVVGICFSVCTYFCLKRCLRNCDKDASETRSRDFAEQPPPVVPGTRPPPVQRTDSVRVTSQGAAPGGMRYSDFDLEGSSRFVEFQNPLTVGDERPDPGRGSSSGTARRPASGDASRGGDRPPDYFLVATTDLTAQHGRHDVTYDVVIRRPEEPPPPNYDVAYVRAGDAPTPPSDASATSNAL